MKLLLNYKRQTKTFRIFVD